MHTDIYICPHVPMYMLQNTRTHAMKKDKKTLIREIACRQRREAMQPIMPSLLILKNDVKSGNMDLFISEKAKHFIGREFFFFHVTAF